MKKFIFSIMAVAFIGMFAACNGTSTTSSQNDSTAVDSVLADSMVVDSTVVDSVTSNK